MQRRSVDENVVTRGSWEPNAVFPLKADSERAHSVFAAALWAIAAADDRSPLYGDGTFCLKGLLSLPRKTFACTSVPPGSLIPRRPSWDTAVTGCSPQVRPQGAGGRVGAVAGHGAGIQVGSPPFNAPLLSLNLSNCVCYTLIVEKQKSFPKIRKCV